MFLTMIAFLYTSLAELDVLGIGDFAIFNRFYYLCSISFGVFIKFIVSVNLRKINTFLYWINRYIKTLMIMLDGIFSG